MSRFISSYMLAKYFSLSACLRISYVIKEHRSKYYELFRNANDKRNRGELTEFVMGYLTFSKKQSTVHISRLTKRIIYTRNMRSCSTPGLTGIWTSYRLPSALLSYTCCKQICLVIHPWISPESHIWWNAVKKQPEKYWQMPVRYWKRQKKEGSSSGIWIWTPFLQKSPDYIIWCAALELHDCRFLQSC